MAVALVENGKVDTSEIVIAYRGTNFDDELDDLGITKSIEYVKGQVMTTQIQEVY